MTISTPSDNSNVQCKVFHISQSRYSDRITILIPDVEIQYEKRIVDIHLCTGYSALAKIFRTNYNTCTVITPLRDITLVQSHNRNP